MPALFRGNNMKNLADVLAARCLEDRGDPMSPTWIAVQSAGMGGWLKTALARRLGCYANVWMPFPRALLDAVFTAFGVPGEGLELEAVRWAVWEELRRGDSRLGDFDETPPYGTDDPTGRKRFGLAGRVAKLFDEYAVYRAEQVLEWDRGVGKDWQAVLWRRAMARLRGEHFAVRAMRASEIIAGAKQRPEGLPDRISLFGISALPPIHVGILQAVSAFSQIDMYVLSPSRHYWGDIRRTKRAAEPKESSHIEQGHPLLASLGRLGRDFQKILETHSDYDEPMGDLHLVPRAEPATLLEKIQADMLELRDPDASSAPRFLLRDDDDSLEIHSCHSRFREIEVVRDILLRLFDEFGTSLKPEQVLVAAVDIDAYAPHVEAVLGGRAGEKECIPYTIKGRSLRSESSTVDTFLRAVCLASGRWSLEQVMEMFSSETVRRSAGLSHEEVLFAGELCERAGIRWGKDAQHRVVHEQPALEQNTWRFGFDRLLLGYAMPGKGEALFEGIMPFDDVEGDTARIIGRFISWVDGLFTLLGRCAGQRTIAEWAEILEELLAHIASDKDSFASEQRIVREWVARTLQCAGEAGVEDPVDFKVVSDLAQQGLGGSQGVRDGSGSKVVFSSLLPMRSIPFDVIVLVGANFGELPARDKALSFDLMAASPRLGDRSARADERHMFLETLLSARRKLVITYAGQDQRDPGVRPPSVLVSELLDLVASTARLGEPSARIEESHLEAVSRRLTVTHPLQPFSPRYFDGSTGKLASYDANHLACARSLMGPSRPAPVFWRRDFAARAPDVPRVVPLHLLVRFYKHPGADFLSRVLKIGLVQPRPKLADREPIELDGLDKYGLEEALLEGLRNGLSRGRVLELCKAAGRLPLGALGLCRFDDLLARVRPIHEEYDRRVADSPPATRVELEVEVPTRFGDVRITGALDDLRPQGRLSATVGRMTAPRELGVWLHHLAGCAALGPIESAVVHREDDGADVRVFAGIEQNAATAWLRELVERYMGARSAPLVFFPRACRTLAEEVIQKGASRGQAVEKALAELFSEGDAHKGGGELTDPANALVFRNADFFGDEGLQRSLEGTALAVYAPMLRGLEGQSS